MTAPQSEAQESRSRDPVAPDIAESPDHVVVFLLLAGSLIRLWFIWAGWCDKYVVADDAYYYFTIARNVATGAGSTFDGLAPTNGYHPLYLWALVPIFSVSTALRALPWIPIHAALTLCAACDIGTGWVIYRLMRMAGYRQAARWAVALWCLSPFSALLSLRGLEGSLNVLLVALWTWQVVWALAESTGISMVAAIRLGILHGLAILARTDNALILTGAMLILGVIAVARRYVGLGRAVAMVGIAGGVAAVVVLPWVVWNIVTFGTPLQVSAAAKITNSAIYGHFGKSGGGVALLAGILRLLAFLWQPIVYVAGEEFKALRYTFVVAWLVIFCVALSIKGLLYETSRPRSQLAALLLMTMLLILSIHACAYAFILQSYSTWYASVPAYVLSVLIGVGLGSLLERATQTAQKLALAVASGAVACVFILFFWSTGIAPEGPSKHFGPILKSVSERAPSIRTIGVFNAGRPGYFAPYYGALHVVNLDCLVNNVAFDAWQHGRYYRYVLEHADALLMDDPDALATWLAPNEARMLLAHYPRWRASSIYGPRINGRFDSVLQEHKP